MLGLGTVLMLCAPSVLWMLTEGWDYATALYFNTITLTTVGFGDYIAGDDGLLLADEVFEKLGGQSLHDCWWL